MAEKPTTTTPPRDANATREQPQQRDEVMPMALAVQPQPASVVRCPGFSSIPTFHGVEKASQTYKKGAFLIDDDAGRLTESTSPVNASAVANRSFGMALQDATGVTDTQVPFVWLGPNCIIEFSLMELTAGNHTLVQADQWKVYPITKATTAWYLNADAVSDTGGALVMGFKDPIGTVNGRVFGIITNTARGGANAASGIY